MVDAASRTMESGKSGVFQSGAEAVACRPIAVPMLKIAGQLDWSSCSTR